MEKMDYKKAYKDLYMPKKKPSAIQVPKMTFIMVDGRGNPNTSKDYKDAMEILYGLSFTIKMSKMSGRSRKDTSSMWFRRWKACGGRMTVPLTAGILQIRTSLTGLL
mgnify:CR=1 FL=1